MRVVPPENPLLIMRPGIMTHQIWLEAQQKSFATLQALEIQLETSFWKSFQILDISSAKEREAIRKLFENTDAELNYCLVGFINRENLNLSSIDPTECSIAIRKIQEKLPEAVECGATYVQITSGPSPQTDILRQQALHQFKDSVQKLAEILSENYGVTLLIEPLDVFAHKRATLGYFEEVVNTIDSLQNYRCSLGVILDTAHSELNNEPPEKLLPRYQPYILELHLANCVTKPDHPYFGDHHIFFGAPGVFDGDRVAQLLSLAWQCGFLGVSRRPRVFVEFRSQISQNPNDALQKAQDFLVEAWFKTFHQLSRIEEP